MRALPSIVTLPTVVCVAMLAPFWWSDGRAAALSLATGYVAAALFAATLLVTPMWRLRRRREAPTHLPLRRSLGVHTGLTAIVHMLVSFPVHLQGDVVRYFFASDGLPLVTTFGLSNWVGLVAIAALIALLVTSTDGSLRRLGARRWKALHRLVWLAAALSFLHTLGYQDIRHASAALTIGLLVASGALAAVRLLGARLSRRVERIRVAPPP